MSFEVRNKDLLGRIGRLRTKSGVVETPLLFPVINPVIQPILPKRIKSDFGFKAIITNSYILKKRFQNKPIEHGLHRFLDYDGVVMTDSGAYQILVYGGVEVAPQEIVQYQEQIGTDIATILDVPTGWHVSEENARQTVIQTSKHAKQLFKQKTRDDILWVGPTQGGRNLNLLVHSARQIGKLPFAIHALGSPTEVMERYRFDTLVDMIITAKMNLPIDRPLHLFGAGHPIMFSLAVALGCDMFDSAAYALYARNDRYMTENGTHRLNELQYFPCTCPHCTKLSPDELSKLPNKEREISLAEHNLYVCAAEIRRIKQAIQDGRLWEYTEMRAHAHPALYTALKKLEKHKSLIEKHSPATKTSGLFFYNSLSLIRPEVTRHEKLMALRYTPPEKLKTLVLIPQPQTRPFHKSYEYKRIRKRLKKELQEAHVCFYAAPFGIVPIELDEVYPLSQHETSMPLDKETRMHIAQQVKKFVLRTKHKKIILVTDPSNWSKTIEKALKEACRRKQAELLLLDPQENQ